MRSPEHRKIAQPRAGRQYEDELQLRYLSPGAFTVLPPESRQYSNPPSAPEPYRVTPGSRRHKNQSFAIIGEVDGSRAGSRAASPTGRSSPFRGRGFNPLGSRHVSPTSSPLPPDDARLTPSTMSPRHVSKIPQLKRRGSSHFGEKVAHQETSSTEKMSNKFSNSMSNLDSGRTGGRSTASPKRTAYSKAPAFQKLSPIIGSSPEPSQSMSSPSRIPKSRSTPSSTKQSPTRNASTLPGKPPPSKVVTISRNPSRSQSRAQSRNQSRVGSRETSPTKNPKTPKTPNTPSSPSRIPVQKYKHIQAKVNSLNKPKVPPKPQDLNEKSEDSESSRKYKKPLNRKDSVNRSKTDSNSNLLPKTGNHNNKPNDSNLNLINSKSNSNINANNKINNNSTNVTKNTTKVVDNKTFSNNNNPPKTLVITKKKDEENNKNNNTNLNKSETKNKESNNSQINSVANDSKFQKRKNNESEDLPSTAAVVPSTTSTVAEPLKIGANLNPSKQSVSKPVSPMIDGRVLSATSVSNAINKMNDTVLDTKTVIRDHGLNKFGQPNSAITEGSNTNTSSSLVTKSTPESSTNRDPEHATTNTRLSQNNHINHVGLGMNSKDLEMEVQKNFNKFINPDLSRINSAQKTINDTIKQARPDLPSDIKPIKITVKEKPSNVEVQSGNVRLPVSVSNGLNDRPGLGSVAGTAAAGGAVVAISTFVHRLIRDTTDMRIPSLPPGQQTPPNEPVKETEDPPKNACTKFLAKCKRKLVCDCCKKKLSTEELKEDEERAPRGLGCLACLSCLSCMKKPKEPTEQPPARISFEDETGKNKKWFDRLKCCGKQKVSDSTSCFPLGKRKESWAERRQSILSSPAPNASGRKCSKDCCKKFWMTVFCLSCSCCKKKPTVEETTRKQSVVSKKKSLTPTTLPPPEDTVPKIDISLVEHTSHMKGAIPILPVCLAWFCLVMNCILPGSGTVFSGLFCLCLGIPRFSQKDGPKPRIGAFLIDTIIGVGQFFTVLFCLVGWGWSIWWGVIMLKVARKHKKFKHLEKIEQATFQPNTNPARTRDPIK